MKKLIYFILTSALFLGTAALSRSFSPTQKLGIAEMAISSYYVDSVDESKLVEDAIKGMLKELDPHSSYSTPEETKEMNEPLEGSFSGIGISFNMNKDTLYVIQTIAGGPSERAGIMAGDRILEVNDTVIAGVKMKNSDIMKRLRGKKGTDVYIKVLRKTNIETDTIDFRITRADIPIYSVDAAYMVEPEIGYIKISRFAAGTAGEFRKACEQLKKEGMKNMILDLTDNGGGFLHAANDLLGEILPSGTLSVYTEGLKSPRQELLTHPKGKKPLFGEGRLVVMLNQNSASASEISAGAIQDWDRGLTVGRRTFGKGLVQRPFPFPDGSMIRLTVAHYYTPTGRNIQKPYTKGDAKDYAKDIMDRFNNGELMHSDSIKVNDSLRVHTMINRRAVYGGGGITPDRFVPLDTLSFSKYYRDAQAKGVFNRYVFSYIDNHRKEIRKKYKKDSDFVKHFNVTDVMLDDFRKTAEQEGVKPDEKGFERSKELIRMIIKALIGRDIYENQTFFKVYNPDDPIFRSALDLIKSDDYDKILTTPDKLVK